MKLVACRKNISGLASEATYFVIFFSKGEIMAIRKKVIIHYASFTDLDYGFPIGNFNNKMMDRLKLLEPKGLTLSTSTNPSS